MNDVNQQFYEITPEGRPVLPPRPPIVSRINWRRVIPIMLVVIGVAVIAIGAFILLRQKSELNRDMQVANSRITIAVQECVESGGGTQEECEDLARLETARDMELPDACRELEDNLLYNCVSLIAYDTLNANVCRTISSKTGRSTCEDHVHLRVAQRDNDIRACDPIAELSLRDTCRRGFVLDAGLAGDCSAFNGGEREACELEVRVWQIADQGHPSECAELPEGYTDSCLDIFMSSDSDGDGLSDFDELVNYNTDPRNADTDGDGFDDGTEVSSGFDPLR